MSDIELWSLSLVVASIVAVVVALLLGLVIATLKNIDRNAADVSTIGKQIAENTVALWTLEQTNRDLARLTDAVRLLEQSIAATGSTPDSKVSEMASKVAVAKQKVEDWLTPSDSGERDPQ